MMKMEGTISAGGRSKEIEVMANKEKPKPL
jgi:hypothetical protein